MKMNKDIEKLIKMQGKINKKRFHLCVDTNLEDKYRWVLFLYNPNTEAYFSDYNRAILYSDVDSIEDLEDYLKKHEGFDRF